METNRWCRTALVLGKNDRYAAYYAEALELAGIPNIEIEKVDANSLHDFDVVLFSGHGSLDEDSALALAQWVAQGGRAVFSGSTWDLASLIGVKSPSIHISSGAVIPHGETRLWPEHCPSAKFFGAERHAKAEAEVHAQMEGGVGLCTRSVGQGKVWYFAPHVGQTMALMQLGRSVETDAVGPADGTVRLDDGILRAEDGANLSFDHDRTIVEGCPTPFFSRAHADAIRETWLRCIVDAMESTKKPFAMTWHWPDDAPAIAMLTIDCPTANIDRFAVLSKVLANVGGRPAWLVGQPGFQIEAYRAMHNALQEVGVLFDGSQEEGWSPERVRMHHVAISRGSAFKRVDGIRPSDGRWEGYTQGYEVAERSGARLSVAKGGRQAGDAGFLFGSCHPIRPRRRNGTPFQLFELPYSVYVPSFPEKAAEAVLAETILRSGCFHVAGELDALADLKLEASLKRLIMLARQAHLRFLLPSEVAQFLDVRRQLRIVPMRDGDANGATLTAPADLNGLSFLAGNLPDTSVVCNGGRAKTRTVRRYGAMFQSIVVNLEGKRTTTLMFHPESDARAA